MIPDNSVWVFVGSNSKFPSGIFQDKKLAQKWISEKALTGTLSAMPLNESVFDWAIQNDALTLKKEKIEEKAKDPYFIQDCLPASLEHYHYKYGQQS